MAGAARRLATAPFDVVGRFADASNATLLARLTDRAPGPLPDDVSFDDLDPADLAVYKPRRGEAPLWDFPPGTLHLREVAAYEVSEALGWDLVPATVLREDGPFGPGSLQRYVAHDPQRHYFALLEEGAEDLLDALRRMVVFDLVIDNADRKAGHVLVEEVGADVSLRVVDHGVSFNVDRKLRTVAWDFADEPVPAGLREDLAAHGDRVVEAAAPLLTAAEADRLRERIGQVVDLDVLPPPVGPRPYPWPLL